ncbi:MAG: hypothetical protein ACPG4K_08945 [Haloferula sp.]
MKYSLPLPLVGFALLSTSAWADVILKETFSGGRNTPLVDEENEEKSGWTGGAGEHSPKAPDEVEAGTDGEETPAAEPKVSIMQDGTVSGISFTAYRAFTLEPGAVYTLDVELEAANDFDNQWLTVGFAGEAKDGDAAPQLDGGTTYGQSVLSGSGYRYGWAGPNTTAVSELKGPGLHSGGIKVVLDTSDASDYTIELFDGSGASMHGPESIGKPAISQIFIGSSGAAGKFTSVTLADDKASEEAAEESVEESGSEEE